MQKTLRIGTRTSLMAMAQARLVAKQIQQHHPHVTCEFVGITSTGDKDVTTPLWQMKVVGVFSRELDERLLEGEVDCVVHSFKDLGTERPQGLAVAAMLPRDNPRDIILFRPDIMEKLASGTPLCIGTSAPRRMAQIPKFLAQALPKKNIPPPRITMESLRGNATSRLQKLVSPKDGGPHYDAIVLALAGLDRLLNDEDGAPVTQTLLDGLRMMVLPLSLCPTAPGQGVICVEAAANRADILELLKPLNNAAAAHDVEAERAILIQHGGGCHQGFGATRCHLPNMDGPLLIVRGQTREGKVVDEDIWQRPEKKSPATVWDTTLWRDETFTTEPLPYTPSAAKAVFVAHARALPAGSHPAGRLWASGTGSWFQLAQQGLWIEGCADGLGFDTLRQTLASPVLNLPPPEAWEVLTHADALSGWQPGQATATYRLNLHLSDAALSTLSQSQGAWWGSPAQFKMLAPHATNLGWHACGAGKTASTLKAAGLNPLVFPSYASFRAWAQECGHTFPAPANHIKGVI